MNLELILMSGNDIAEFKKMYSVHFKKDFKYKVKRVSTDEVTSR